MQNLNKRVNSRSIFISILLGLSLIIILFFYQGLKKQIQSYLLNWVGKIALESSNMIDHDITKKFSILDKFVHDLSKEELENPKKLAESFREVVSNNNLKRMAFATVDGTAYCDNGEIINIEDRRYFRESIKGKRWVSQALDSKIDGKRSNVFSIPVYMDKNIVGVLVFSVFTDTLYQEFNLDIMEQIGDAIVINVDGSIIVSDEKNKFTSSGSNLFDSLESRGIKVQSEYFKYNSKGYVELKFSDKNDYILYYSKLSCQDLWLVSLVDYTAIKDSYHYIIEGIIGILFLTIFLVSIVFLYLFNRERRRLEELEDTAYTDAVTGGYNDKYLRNYMNQFVCKKNEYAFISLEITNVKKMVNTLGLKNTGFILNEIYNYLQELLVQEGIVVHSYLGEYKLLIKYGSIKRLNQKLQQINLTKINENLDFIMGVYLVDDLEVSYNDLCLYASIAKEFLNNSKDRELKYIIYNQQIHKKEIDKFKLEEDIKHGIENKEFKTWFQPQYGRDGKTIVGAEALVRWYKYGSVISPYIFIPTCEANGFIKKVDELVFEDVCKNLRDWIDNGKNVVPIGVNLSRSYLDRTDFITNLESYMEQYRIPRELIHFEIIESSMIGNEEQLKDIVSMLHEKGFKVSVDDFGVGYSSLKAISSAHFDTLKIDKSFIDGIGDPKWENIIKYTIHLANNLDMTVVAEGVETKEQYEFLLECHCNRFQGYYFTKPMDAKDFSKLI